MYICSSFYIHNKIGCICLPSKAYSIVFTKYVGSKAIDEVFLFLLIFSAYFF